MTDPSHKDHQIAHRFMLHMALNHEVTPEVVKGRREYGGPSPDEIAFVWFAKHMGYEYTEKPSRTTLRVAMPLKGGQEQTFEILNVLQFNSTRKRSSVIPRQRRLTPHHVHEGRQRHAARLAKGSVSPKVMEATQHIADFSQDGLRILIASRYVPEAVYQAWATRYSRASTSLLTATRRDVVMDEIEQDLELWESPRSRTSSRTASTRLSLRSAGVQGLGPHG